MSGNTPSTTLDDVTVKADAPTATTNNPTASSVYKPPSTDDTLSLVIAGTAWAGWQRVAVKRGMDTIPASFDVQVTERYPNPSSDISIKPGDPCQVKIGSDLVITGYVDRYAALGVVARSLGADQRAEQERGPCRLRRLYRRQG